MCMCVVLSMVRVGNVGGYRARCFEAFGTAPDVLDFDDVAEAAAADDVAGFNICRMVVMCGCVDLLGQVTVTVV